jgi:purine-nucleoside phosphorylase
VVWRRLKSSGSKAISIIFPPKNERGPLSQILHEQIVSAIYNSKRSLMKGELIVKPPPLPGFSKEKVVCIPGDTPSRFIFKTFQKRIRKTKTKPFGEIFLLDDRIILYRCVGAPTTVMALERLVASGAKEILFLGFCGSLNPDIKILDAVCITEAFSEEGTSKHYFSSETLFRASTRLKKEMETALQSRQLPYLCGTAVSTDAPYRETQGWLENKMKKRIDVVDMEVSAVFAFAFYHRLQAAALLLVSDKLTSQGHTIGFHQPETEKRIEQYFLPFLFD